MVGVVADPRHQVAGPLGGEEVERQRLHVRIGAHPQIGRHPLAHPGEDPGLGPGEEPGDQRRGHQPAQIPPHEGERDVLAGLPRDQHAVDQRHRQVGGDEGRHRARQRQATPEQRHPRIRPRERQDAEERPPRRRGILDGSLVIDLGSNEAWVGGVGCRRGILGGDGVEQRGAARQRFAA